MARYVDSILIPGEQVVHTAHVSWLSMLPAGIGGGLLMLMGLLSLLASGTIGGVEIMLGLLWLGVAWLKRATTELAVTNKRVIAKTGLIGRHTVEMNLTKVESLKVDQSIIGRILGYGSIVVAGTGSTQTPIPYIDDPMEFKRAVTESADGMQRSHL